MLQDQFIIGLKEELRRQERKTPGLSFEEVKMEALAQEEEQDEQWLPSTCLAVNKQTPCPTTHGNRLETRVQV